MVRMILNIVNPLGRRRAVVMALTLSLVVAACGDETETSDDRPLVVATTTILGDLARQVVGESARVEVLMPIDADPHDFQPSSGQVALLADADLVVANGLGLEEGLEDAIESTAGDGVTVLWLAAALDPIPFADHGEEAENGSDHGDLDPHVWMDPLRMAEGARLLAAALEEAAPGEDWTTPAEAYAQELLDADQQIIEILTAVPDEKRLLVTNHDSLGYFAARYGFEVLGTVIPGGSTTGEPSSQDLAALVALITDTGVPAIFSETTAPQTVVDAIVAEVGVEVAVVDLYSGSLGPPGTEADTLIGMLVENARRIAGALS